MKLLIPICIGLLLSGPLFGQRTIVGRVTDRATGAGIPGVTVTQSRSDNATTTTADGTFSLPRVPADTAGVALFFSAIGYIPVERLVAADSVHVVLLGDVKCFLAPDAIIELVSGLRYTPLGGRLQAYGYRYALPLRATLGYQTNFRRNAQQHFQLEWLGLRISRLGTFDVGVRRQAVRNLPHRLQFRSYSLTVEADFYRRLPVLLLGLGRARLRETQRPGFGYEGGLRHSFSRPRLAVQATAARWPGYWQWQGEIRHRFRRLHAGVRLSAVNKYAELSASLGYELY